MQRWARKTLAWQMQQTATACAFFSGRGARRIVSASRWSERGALKVTDLLFPTVTPRGRWSGVSRLRLPLWPGTSSTATEP